VVKAADAEVLSWGFRSRLALLMLLIVGALAAAMWSGLRDQGVGEPEDRRKLMVVTQPGSEADYHAVLERGGFVIEVGEFAAWEDDAAVQLPESEAQGVALLLEYADLRGFGFVVFEAPAKLDFSGIDLEPSLDEIEQLDAREYAAVSVGDLAFPHRLAVDEVGEPPLLRVPGHAALEAVLEQPAVYAREDDDRPTVAELQHEAAIEMARRMSERPATFEQTIANAGAMIERRLSVDADARTLVGPFATGSAVPTPEGVLLVHHALDIYSDDALTLEQGVGETLHFEWLDDAALARVRESGESTPTPCPSLAAGSIQMRRGPQIEAAVDGSALAISTRDEPMIIWRKLAQPGCAWAEQARISSSSALDEQEIVLAPRFTAGPDGLDGQGRSMMAEFGDDGTQALVRLWLTPQPSGVEEPIELLRLPVGIFKALAFIDDVHLVALARVPLPSEEQTASQRHEFFLHLLDRRRPGAHLRIPAEFFAGERSVRELAVVRPAVEGEGPRFAATLVADGVDTELAVLTIGAAAWQRFVDGEPDPTELFTLTPEELDMRSLERAPAIAALAVGPEGIVHALANGATPAEIVVHPLDGGPERQLTNNELVDTLPHFTADGRAVVFVTGVRSSLSITPFSVPRIAWLE
jgi:hypothetical protein